MFWVIWYRFGISIPLSEELSFPCSNRICISPIFFWKWGWRMDIQAKLDFCEIILNLPHIFTDHFAGYLLQLILLRCFVFLPAQWNKHASTVHAHAGTSTSHSRSPFDVFLDIKLLTTEMDILLFSLYWNLRPAPNRLAGNMWPPCPMRPRSAVNTMRARQGMPMWFTFINRFI